jgi:cation diffusion facilitator family transporter
MSREKNESIFAVWISLISNVILTAVKLIVGVLFNSQVLVADGVHNAGDVIATGAALSSMRISKRPADEDHPYGHGKAEVLGAGIVALILGLAALYMAFHAITAFFEEPAPASFIALIAAFLSLVWKQWLYVYTIRIGRLANSKGLIATAYDHLADVYASAAAVAGIGLAMIGERYGIHLLAYGDPAAGIVVSVLVLKLAYEMGQEAIDVLMEKTISGEMLEDFEKLITSVEHVKRIDRLRARELGHYILVDARVSVPGTLSIQEGHDISRQIKKAIMERHNDVDEVLIHLNPWYE